MFELGSKLRDEVTGFEGVAIARAEWLNGCVRYAIQPPAKDDKMPEPEWVDEQQLAEVEGSAHTVSRSATGGPQRDPRRSRPAPRA